MAKVAKQLRPKVEGGVVKHETPQPRQAQPLAPPAPVKIARAVGPKTQAAPPQQQTQLNPQTVTRRNKGCSGCRRKRYA